VSGPKNMDRHYARFARRDARAMLKIIQGMRGNKRVVENVVVREHVVDCQRRLENLVTLTAETCCHCGEKVPFGCTQCAGCADERGP
jgi:tRNA G26 N,N-dimethylase Trm1